MGLRSGIVLAFALSASVAFAQVDPRNCPDKFTVTYDAVQPATWDSSLEQAQTRTGQVHALWATLAAHPQLVWNFRLYTRTDSSACYYAEAGSTAFAALQTNNGKNELVVNDRGGMFRSGVLSFATGSLMLSQDSASLTLFAPSAYSYDSDGGLAVSQWVAIGLAKASFVSVP